MLLLGNLPTQDRRLVTDLHYISLLKLNHMPTTVASLHYLKGIMVHGCEYTAKSVLFANTWGVGSTVVSAIALQQDFVLLFHLLPHFFLCSLGGTGFCCAL